MKKVMVVMLILISGSLFAQDKDVWVRDYDTATDRSGYRDLKGRLMLPHKFVGLPPADSFHNIIAVMEELNEKYFSYYLIKDGRKVGVDSVYVFDFQYDCENEGKILFFDKKNDKVGFFDKNGEVVIPALYNSATPFQNGLSFALQYAKRKCADEAHQDCEHWTWDGGVLKLINDKNEVLVDSIRYKVDDLDLFSLKVNTPGTDTSVSVSFKGKNGDSYSFIDVEKEFQQWFHKDFIPSLKSKNRQWENYLFDRISLNIPDVKGGVVHKKEFCSRMANRVSSLSFSEDSLTRMTISKEWFAPFYETEFSFAGYCNSCGRLDISRYPLFEVVITRYKKRSVPLTAASPDDDLFYFNHEKASGEHYRFIRTENGFRLYEMSVQ